MWGEGLEGNCRLPILRLPLQPAVLVGRAAARDMEAMVAVAAGVIKSLPVFIRTAAAAAAVPGQDSAISPMRR